MTLKAASAQGRVAVAWVDGPLPDAVASLARRRSDAPVAATYRALVRWLYGGVKPTDLVQLSALQEQLPHELALLHQGCAKSRVSAITTARAMMGRLFPATQLDQEVHLRDSVRAGVNGTAAAGAAAAGLNALTECVSLGEALRHISPWPSWHPRGSDPIDIALADSLETLAEALARVPELGAVADALGTVEKASRQTNARATGRGEVVGVTLSGDVLRSLPSDRALLADPLTEDLFYARTIEHRLLSFEERSTDEQPRTSARTGPAIVCVDTSGSMRGTLETLAKATFCAVARRLLSQGRAVDVVLFGGKDSAIQRSFRPGVVDPNALLTVMLTSFYGGTDLDQPLMRALTSRTGALAGADVLLITDGVGRLAAATVDAVLAAQATGMQLITALVGHHGRWLDDLSDACYVVDAQDRGLPSFSALG